MRGVGFKLILVDDSDVDAEMVARWVQKSPWEIDFVHVPSCEDAVDLLEQMQPSKEWIGLLLVDLSLPGCDGRTLLSRIKTDPSLRHIPTVIMTSSAREADIRDCYSRGANGYVTKPVDAGEFRERIDIVLRYWVTLAPWMNRKPSA